MITGFFYPETVAKKRELKQFGKIFTITIGANLFYLLWEILLAVEKRENIKEALLARFEKRVPEDFILWNFSPLSPHLWYLQALLYVLVIAFIVEHLGLEKAGLSGDSGAVGGKSHKGKLFPAFCGKRRLSYLLCKELSVLRTCPFSGWAAWFGDRKEALRRAVWTRRKWDCFAGRYFLVFWNMARYGAEDGLRKVKCSWEHRKSMVEPFFWQSASFFFLLAGRIFIRKMLVTRSNGKNREKIIPC